MVMKSWTTRLVGTAIMVFTITSLKLVADDGAFRVQKWARVHVHRKEKVKVNGSWVPNSSPIFSGDRIETDMPNWAEVDAESWNLHLIGSFTYLGDILDITCGPALVISRTRAVSVRAANLTVSPISEEANFVVDRESNELTIETGGGSVLIDDGTYTAHLGELSIMILSGAASGGNASARSEPYRLTKGVLKLFPPNTGRAGVTTAIPVTPKLPTSESDKGAKSAEVAQRI